MTRRHLRSILATLLMVAATSRGGAAAGESERPTAAELQRVEEQKKQAVAAARKLGPDHTGELAEAYAGLAEVYLKQERMTEAKLLLEQSLLLIAQAPGADLRVLDQVYQELATVRLLQKNRPEAESLLKRSMAVREQRLGPDHPDVAETLDRLADLGFVEDRAAALALHKRAFAIREKHAGANPADVVKWLAREAQWYEQRILNDEAGAEAIWKRLLPLQEQVLGPEHRDVADTLMKLAACHVHLSESGSLSMTLDLTPANMFPSEAKKAQFLEELHTGFRDSEPLLVRARAIREKALGHDHADTVRTLEYLAAGYALGQDWARAVPLYQRMLSAREKAHRPEDPGLEGPLAVLAHVAMTEYRYRDAIPLLKRLVAIQAAEEAKKPKNDDAFDLDRLRLAAHSDEAEADDPNDYAAQLRNAIRYAKLGITAASFPTAEDLAFLKSERWCAADMDLPRLLRLTRFTAYGKHIDNAALAHLRGLINLKELGVIPGAKPMDLNGSDAPPFQLFTQDVGAGMPEPNISNIDDAGLAQLRNLTLLEELHLSGTAIHGSGLSVLGRMSELHDLDLSWTHVDDAGLGALPVLPKLQSLNLSRTAVGDASLPVLKRLTGLKQLTVIATKISAEGVAELQRTIPNLEVIGPVYHPNDPPDAAAPQVP